MKQIATVVNNNQPDWQNIIETRPNVTLPIGTPLYLAEPHAALGSPLGGGFFAGEMTIDGVNYALVVAPKAEGEKMELEYKLKEWRSADGATSDDDGMLNSEKLADRNHPAADFCRSLKIGDHADWYLPSRDELAMIWRNLGLNRKNCPELFKAGAAEAFEQEWYWSSTENASYSGYAWDIGFDGGYQDGHNKSTSAGVRAVRRFKI
jgi:hypothetical protein